MLNLPGTTLVRPDTDALFEDLGDILMAAAMEAVRQRGVFHLALSGGSTPEPFYMRLVTDPRYRPLPWHNTHVWIVDERRVPEDSDQSNIRMIRESLTDHTGGKRTQVHAIPALAGDPAAEYEATLRDVCGASTQQPPRLDFVLLGMGDDCHTASLFPHSPAIDVTDRWIAVNQGANVTPPDRVTMTYPLLNAARQLAVLCVGAKKHPALQRVATLDAPDPHEVPISGIRPAHADGDLTWYLDTAAAGQA